MRTLNLSLTEGAIRRMTLKVENDWSNPPIDSGVDRELLGSVYSLVNVPVQVWKQIQDFMIPSLDEPTGLGAIVEAEFRWEIDKDWEKSNIRKARFVKTGTDSFQSNWYLESSPNRRSMSWGMLRNPRIISEGVQK